MSENHKHGHGVTTGARKPPAGQDEWDALFLAKIVMINVEKEYQNSTAHGKGNEAGKRPVTGGLT